MFNWDYPLGIPYMDLFTNMASHNNTFLNYNGV